MKKLYFIIFIFTAFCLKAQITNTPLAGKPLNDFPWFQYINNFQTDDTVYLAIDPNRFPSLINQTINVFIIESRTPDSLIINPYLEDVRGAAQEVMISGTSIQENIFILDQSSLLEYQSGYSLGVGYDLILDIDNNEIFSTGDIIDGLDSYKAGFYKVHNTADPGPFTPVIENYFNENPWLNKRICFPANFESLGELALVIVSHGWTYDYLMYDYIGEHLASYGYFVVIHANDVGSGEHAATNSASLTTLDNTDHFIGEQSTIFNGYFDGHIDKTKIAFLGHSTGGEGIVRAYTRVLNNEYIPEHFELEDIKLLCPMAPTAWQTNDLTDPDFANFHLFSCAADTDCSLFPCPENHWRQSFSIFERSKGNRQLTYIHGAGHTDLNDCEVGCNPWVDPLAPDLIGKENTHLVVTSYLLPLLEWYLNDNPAGQEYSTRTYDDFHPIGIPEFVQLAKEFKQKEDSYKLIVDDYQTNESLNVSSSGSAVSFDVNNIYEIEMRDNDQSLNWTGTQQANGFTRSKLGDDPRCVIMDWDDDDDWYYSLNLPEFSNLAFEYLSFRACQGTRHPNTVLLNGGLSFQVLLIDGSENIASVSTANYGLINQPYQRGGGWANEFETIIIRLSDFTINNPDFNLNEIATIRFEFGNSFNSETGRLAIDDIELIGEKETFMAQAGINTNLKVYLEGPYDSTNMNTCLNSEGLIPLSQPFSIEPWNYYGTENVDSIPNAEVVDWVLVELRDAVDASLATSETMIAQQAAFLLNNGSIVGLDGSSILSFNHTIIQSLFLVVWHRNHLGIMSANPVLESGGIFTYDFSTDEGQVYSGANGHKEIGTGVWGMISGDANTDGQIDESDKDAVWALQAGNSEFLAGDFTMESQVNNNDKNDIWLLNNGRGTQTPDNKNDEDYRLSWRFANPTIFEGLPPLFQFDIELKCDEIGTYHAQTQIYFDYDTLAFGSNIDGIPQNPDINERISCSFLELMDPGKYLITNDANNCSNRYAIITQPIDENYPIALNNLTEVDTSYKGFLRFQIEIQDQSCLAGIFFSEWLLDGGQYYLDIDSDTLPEKYVNPCLYANDMIDVPLFYTPTVQEYTLINGYQFISSRVIPENPDILIICDEILDNLDFIRNSSGQVLHKIGPNWVNNIGDWIIDEGYLFKMYSDDSFSIEGIAVDPSTPISLSTGFQFVSYFPEAPMDALIAFETILNDDLDFIRNSSGGTLRKIGPVWVNGIGDCIPGEGYLVKMFTEGEIIYPEAAKSSGKVDLIPTHFAFDGGNAADPVYTMYINGLEIGDEVAAYDGEKLVGSMEINSMNALDNDLPVFNTINNGQGYTPGKPITLKVWSDNQIINADFTMETAFDSYVADVFPDEDGEYSLVKITKGVNNIENPEKTFSIFPNPSEGIFNILINGVSGKIQIKVFDVHGNDKYFFEIEGAKNMITEKLDITEIPAGIYFISFNGKDFCQVKKIVIQ